MTGMDLRDGFVGTIGNTPLIRLHRLSERTGCEILGKAEFLNPGSSVKDRAAWFIVKDAEAKGQLRPGGVIVEGTAGNTGIGLALVGRARGYRTLIVIPETQSQEKKDMLRLAGAELGFTRLDGATRDRAGAVARFQSDDGPPVFLISLRAGGTGLNLTAADHVYLLDPWWNPAVEDQAADRAHRIGQDRPVFVHRMVAADTVARTVVAPAELPVGVVTALIGVPVFLWLLLRSGELT